MYAAPAFQDTRTRRTTVFRLLFSGPTLDAGRCHDSVLRHGIDGQAVAAIRDHLLVALGQSRGATFTTTAQDSSSDRASRQARSTTRPGRSGLRSRRRPIIQGIYIRYVENNATYTGTAGQKEAGGGLNEQFVDYYTYIYNATAAAAHAPVGVTASCASAATVTISWYDALPHQSYRVLQGFDFSNADDAGCQRYWIEHDRHADDRRSSGGTRWSRSTAASRLAIGSFIATLAQRRNWRTSTSTA